jgi:transcriptional regulator with XRE-family HTH domain
MQILCQIISQNIKFLRKKKGLTQQQFADQVGIKRSLVGAYEEERAEPKYELLKTLALFFDITLMILLMKPLMKNGRQSQKATRPICVY